MENIIYSLINLPKYFLQYLNLIYIFINKLNQSSYSICYAINLEKKPYLLKIS